MSEKLPLPREEGRLDRRMIRSFGHHVIGIPALRGECFKKGFPLAYMFDWRRAFPTVRRILK